MRRRKQQGVRGRDASPRFMQLALMLLIGSLALGCGGGSSDSQPPSAVSVEARPVQEQPLARNLRATGTLFGEEETTVSAKVSGRVKEVLRDVGDEVAPGEALLKIDDTDYALARTVRLESAREALAKIGLSALPTEQFDVSKLPSVERARLQAENVRSRFERAQKLHQHDPPLLSDQEFNDLQTQYDVAKNDSRIAVLAAKSLIAEARAQFAQLDQSEQLLRDTVHTVPIGMRPGTNGTVSSVQYLVATRTASVGDYVAIGAPLFRLIDPDPLKLRIPVPERHLGKIAVGQRASVTTDAYSDSFAGEISRISPAVDIQSRTFEVEILIPNQARKLRAGMFARADISIGATPALLVPQTAVRSFAGVNKVILVEGGKAVEKQVELGQKEGSLIEIVSGVVAGSVVVEKPPLNLSAGTPVTLSQPPPKEGSS